VTLRLNGLKTLTVGNGPFAFPTLLPDGTRYFVDVVNQPVHGTCTVPQALDIIAGADVTNLQVECVSNDSRLASLSLSAPPAWIGALDPPFAPALPVFDYLALAKLPVLPEIVSPVLNTSAVPADENAKVNVSVPGAPDGGPPVLGPGQTRVLITVTAADSRTTSTYGVTVSSVWSHYLKASNTRQTLPGMGFGTAVSIDGDTLAVGAPQDPSCNALDPQGFGCPGAGTAYVFQNTGGQWTEQAFLKAPDPSNGPTGGPQFGTSIGISGDTAVVGAPFEASCSTGVGVNWSGAGCPGAGAAYVFTRSNGTWSQQAYLKASNTASGVIAKFGSAVAISGDTIVVGAPGEPSCATGVNGNQSDASCAGAGAAYVFVRSAGTWSQLGYLKASNTAASNAFGCAVGLAGGAAIVGAFHESGAGSGVNGDETQPDGGAFTAAGAAYVFGESGTTWSQQAYLKASDNAAGSRFGASVAIAPAASGSHAVVGAPGAGSGNGEAYGFSGAGTSWTSDGPPLPVSVLPDAGELVGTAVAIDVGPTTYFVLGATGDATCGAGVTPTGTLADLDASFAPTCSGQGAAFLTNGANLNLFLKPEIGLGLQFGSSVAVSGESVAVGAPGEPGCAQGIDGDPTSNICTGSGAVYVF
jgi:FG-GAP repeat protein